MRKGILIALCVLFVFLAFMFYSDGGKVDANKAPIYLDGVNSSETDKNFPAIDQFALKGWQTRIGDGYWTAYLPIYEIDLASGDVQDLSFSANGTAVSMGDLKIAKGSDINGKECYFLTSAGGYLPNRYVGVSDINVTTGQIGDSVYEIDWDGELVVYDYDLIRSETEKIDNKSVPGEKNSEKAYLVISGKT